MTIEAKDPQTLIKQAYQALKQNDKAAAERLAWRAVKLAPDLEAPWLILATLAEPDKAIEYVQKALQINPESRHAQEAFKWAFERYRSQPHEPIQKPQPEPATPAPTVVAPTTPQTRPLKVPPAQRVKSTGWVKPAGWVEPAETAKPVRGVKPAREVKPLRGVKPTQRVKPAEGAKPARQVKPTQQIKRRPFEFKRFVVLLIAIDVILIGLVVTLILLRPKPAGIQQSSSISGDFAPALTLGGQFNPNYAPQPESDGLSVVPPQWPGLV
ncbi:MAG: tetratricopeptide repeat protein, partial [Anaerolineaceae bacterium]